MSYNSLFGNPTHPRTNIHNDPVKANLGTKLNNVRDRRHTQQEIPIFDVGNSVTYQPVSAYGASLLDTTSLADLRATILENTNEEAIRLLADGNNEINFYTGGTGASNLKLQVLNSSIDVKNSATLNTANIVVGTNNYITQKIEDSDARVFVESTGKRQYCLYSYEAGSNSGMLVQADANDILAINNYKNSAGGYRPICVNRSDTTYVVMGASINPTSISPVNFVSNGQSVFCNGASPLLHISSSSIKPYTSIIPNGVNSEDLGNATNYFGETHTNYANIRNEMFMNFFNSSNVKATGMFFRTGFTGGTGIQDNMCIRPHNQSGANDGIMISAYGGVSINCGAILSTNDNGTDGLTNRAMLINSTINNYVNQLPSGDGNLDIGSASFKFGNIYGNNIRAHTSLYTDNIRPYSTSPIHFHNTNVTFDANQNISVDNLFSSATNRDLYLGNGPSAIKMAFRNAGNIEVSSDLIPSSNAYDLGTFNNRFVQIHGTTINASNQISTDLISPYAGGSGTTIKINGDLLPENAIGGSGTRQLGNNTHLWAEVFAQNPNINTSDRTMKKDIQPITNALQFVRKLKPVQYKWKKNSHGRVHTGFIAQDVLQANPLGLGDNWSGYIDTGNGLGLRYGEFISVNTQAIKELDEKLKIMAIRLNNTDCGEGVKVDLNYHTDSSEVIERLEILENRELTPITEEYDDSELKEEMKQLKIEMIDLKIENKKQEDCISQLICDNMNLTEKLNMLMERFDKFVNDKPNVEMKIIDDSDMLLSETGDNDHMELVEQRLHTLETKLTKVENKQKKITTIVNKLNKA